MPESPFGNLAEALQVSIQRELARTQPTVHEPRLVAALVDYSNRLGELGYWHESLSIADEAVDLCEALLERLPDSGRSMYASCLSNLSLRLAELGRPDDALAVIREAVEICRGLDLGNVDSRAASLGRALSNLSVDLMATGALDESVEAARESVDLYRAARAARRGSHQPDFVVAMSNWVLALSRLGRRAEAVDAAQRLVNVYRTSEEHRDGAIEGLRTAFRSLIDRRAEAARDPDGLEEQAAGRAIEVVVEAGHLSTLHEARAVSAHADRLADVGRGDDAIEANREAVRLWRLLGDIDERFREDLALTLANQALSLTMTGRLGEALVCREESLALRRALATIEPRRFGPLVGLSLLDSSNLLFDMDRQSDGMSAVAEAVGIFRSFAAVEPGIHDHRFALALHNYAFRAGYLGQYEHGLVAAQEAVEIRRSLAEAYPTLFASDLASSLRVLAEQQRGLGRVGEAG